MKLQHTRVQIILEVIAFVLLVILIAYPIIVWGHIPDKIPGHYNAAGEVDRWGSKSEVIFEPIVGICLYVLMTVIAFFPKAWNVPVTITEENKERVYGTLKTMLILMKAEVLVVFLYLSYNSVQATSLSPVFLPLILLGLFGTVIFFCVRAVKLGKTQE